MLRDMASAMPKRFARRALVFDSSNEAGGDNLEPHGSLGLARRCQPADCWNQAPQMLDAVLTHKPDVFLVDEVSTFEDAKALCAIAGRGVAVVACVRLPGLDAVMRDQNLCDLVGVPRGQLTPATVSHYNNANMQLQLC
jgi:stage III sporulation protein SpoIIIAA